MLIGWTNFPWEALATFVTGLLAVGAAFIVARRQTAILDRQTRQAELDLREKLFERRIKVYDRARRYLWLIVENGGPPDRTADADFLKAVAEADFLFATPVQERLDAIFKNVSRLRANRSAMAGDLIRTNVSAEQAIQLDDDIMSELIAEWENVRAIFGEHLNLSSAGLLPR